MAEGCRVDLHRSDEGQRASNANRMPDRLCPPVSLTPNNSVPVVSLAGHTVVIGVGQAHRGEHDGKRGVSVEHVLGPGRPRLVPVDPRVLIHEYRLRDPFRNKGTATTPR